MFERSRSALSSAMMTAEMTAERTARSAYWSPQRILRTMPLVIANDPDLCQLDQESQTALIGETLRQANWLPIRPSDNHFGPIFTDPAFVARVCHLGGYWVPQLRGRVEYIHGRLSNHTVETLVRKMGARFLPMSTGGGGWGPYTFGVVLWPQPAQPYEKTRLQLWIAAAEVIRYWSADDEMDTRRARFAAECRKASHQGYMSRGSKDPSVIEEAVFDDVQDLLVGDMRASIPDAEMMTR